VSHRRPKRSGGRREQTFLPREEGLEQAGEESLDSSLRHAAAAPGRRGTRSARANETCEEPMRLLGRQTCPAGGLKNQYSERLPLDWNRRTRSSLEVTWLRTAAAT
jgi:hypothetical protein